MSRRHLYASSLMACLLAVGVLCIAPVTVNTASAGPLLAKPGESARNNVILIKRRGRSPWHSAPIAPSYLYYDYPYYYSRGHYPTHIRPGFIYFGYPYAYYGRNYDPRYGARCSSSHRKCVAGWSYDRGPGSPRRQRARRN